MKKVLFATITIMILTWNTIQASTTQENIINTRQKLGGVLTNAIHILQAEIKLMDDTIYQEKTEIEDLHLKAKLLQERSEKIEVNPTIIKQGIKEIVKCSSNKELYWTGSTWGCRSGTANADCNANEHEDKLCTNGSECVCSFPYTSSPGYQSWTECDNTLGERYSVPPCTVSSSKTPVITYEAASSACPTRLFEQACGPNASRSTCQCGGDRIFVEADGKAYCAIPTNCPTGFSPGTGNSCSFHDGTSYSSAAQAGGHTSYTGYFEQGGSFNVSVWTEDLNFYIGYSDISTGQVYWWQRQWHAPSKTYTSKDGDDAVNTKSFSFYINRPGKLYIYVQEGGHAGSQRLGYSVDVTAKLSGICRHNYTYNPSIQMCSQPAPICLKK